MCSCERHFASRLFRKAVQQGRSKRRGESYSLPYVEPLSVARMPLADFVNSLLERKQLEIERAFGEPDEGNGDYRQ